MASRLRTGDEGIPAETPARHSLLNRQIRRHLGPETAISGPWMNLVRAVDDAYRQSDDDRAMLERALEISSQELLHANSQTRAMLEATPSLFLRVAFDGTILETKPSPLVALFCLNEQVGDEGRRLVLRPEFLERFQSSLVPLMQGKPTATFEIEPDGAQGRLFQVRMVTVASNQTVLVIRDVSEERAAEASLRESETQFRLFAEAMPQLVWIARTDGGTGYRNQKWVDYTGLTAQESDGDGWKRAIHPDDVSRAGARWRHAAETGEPYEIEYRLRRVDGTYHWMLVRALPLRDDAGVIVKWLGTSTDVDELRQALEAVSSSEERLRVIARVSGDAIWDWNFVSQELRWNEGLTVLFGYPPHEVDSIDAWSRHFHSEDRARVLETLYAVLQDGRTTWSDEYRFLRKDGTVAYIFDRAHVIRDAEGNPVRMIGCMTDLTQRRTAEERLAQQAALIDEAQDAIFVRDLDHRITFWSKGAERIYGWRTAEANGARSCELLKVDSAAFEAAQEVVLREGEWSGEMERTAASGAILIVSSHWTLMRDGEGRPKAVLGIETDITERKKLEQQFLRAQRLESIGTLSGGIAHDLNNLLMPIMMGVDLLRRLKPDEAQLQVIKNIERSAKRGANLVKQMVSFARGVDGARVAVNVGEVIVEVQSIAESTFPKNVRVECDLPEDLWSILGDATQVHQVLVNLCVNARDAMPRGGLLSVSARNIELDVQHAAMHPGAAAGQYVVLRVADDGMGMTTEVLNRIFEPFFTTKALGKGTGLGMSTTLGIVRSHGGFVQVQSEPGNGSSIEVYFPAKTEGATPEVEHKSEVLPRGDGETIMVVDDETSILDITRQTLESFGYKVITAGDGAEAIALYALHQAEIAVVLTDIMMPVMDGAVLAGALRRIAPGVKILITSGHYADTHAAEAANVSLEHFLAKPYSTEVMLCALANILGKEKPPSPSASPGHSLPLHPAFVG